MLFNQNGRALPGQNPAAPPRTFIPELSPGEIAQINTRARALDLACATYKDSTAAADLIVDAAAKFYAFIRG